MDPYLYQYALGGVVFAVGLYYAARHRYIGWSGRPLRRLVFLLVGLGFFAGLQAYLQYGSMAETVPAKAFAGDYERRTRLGEPIDYVVMAAYFLAILAVGTWFGRRQKSIKDFFFGGQRFSWWLIALSLVATTVGSYSFVKYSRVAYSYGLSSTQTYFNDWFWVPLLVFGWLPLLYFSRITSIPEYFERRYGRDVRLLATIILLIYLVSYVGVNLFTMGTALNVLLGWPVWKAAILVASISAIYVTFGGQTSVIMTDLFQGLVLLATGMIILALGISHLGGFEEFWTNLPRGHRTAFPNFNTDPSFSGVGVFWQDAMANSAMFYFLNQGMIMRFLAARSINDARRSAVFMLLVLMPLAACVVASGGWVGKALVHAGVLPPDLDPKEAFFMTAEFLSRPGLFGLILAALTAALMSTVDTLITAVSAIVVNDVYKPYFSKAAGEKTLLRVARISAVCVTLLGILLVPVFMTFKSIYSAHGAMTAAVTPPLVVALMFSVFWRRYTRVAALWTLGGGIAAIILSMFVPEVIRPFAHGVPQSESGDGFLAGFRQFKFMRACYGLSVSATIGIVVTLVSKPEPEERKRGLVWGTIKDAIYRYKGSPGSERRSTRSDALVRDTSQPRRVCAGTDLPQVTLSRGLATALDADAGDLVYLSDARRWLGGLYSAHAIVDRIDEAENRRFVDLDGETLESIVTRSRLDRAIRVERLY